jgi:hypothetical protein
MQFGQIPGYIQANNDLFFIKTVNETLDVEEKSMKNINRKNYNIVAYFATNCKDRKR